MSQGNSAPPQKVEEMFDRISGVYDGMNLAISGFQEPRWRKRIVQASEIGPGGSALDVACGPGTYVRALARDLGRALGCGASLSALRRLSSGQFSAEQAVPLSEIERAYPDPGTPSTADARAGVRALLRRASTEPEFYTIEREGERRTAAWLARSRPAWRIILSTRVVLP